MKQRHLFTRILCLLFVALVACQTGAELPSTPQATATTSPSTGTPEPSPSPLPTITASPTLTPTPDSFSPSELFERIAPSVAFVETSSGTGSGLYIGEKYLLTNAHVVWPHREARVVFADGYEVEDAPVYRLDLMADIAVLGPLEGVEANPLTLADGEALSSGSQVYLIGYPGEVERLPEPTITGGIISRLREWEQEGITYFQTDATFAGGQSGGALVSDRGDVIGLSGFAFTEALFGLVASAADLSPRLEQLLADELPTVGNRLVSYSDGANQHTVVLTNEWDSIAFVLENLRDGDITLTAQSGEDIILSVVNRYGEVVGFADDSFGGEETLVVSNPQGVYFVQLATYSLAGASVTLTASGGAQLIQIADRDDHRNLNPEQPIHAAIDHPGDLDVYQLRLAAGAIVNLSVDSANIDALLTVAYPGAGPDQLIADDNTGGGFTGRNADLTYRAPHAGFYFVIVRDANNQSMGGYTLSASSSRPGAPTPVAPAPTAVPIISPSGDPMYEQGKGLGFSLQTPAWWTRFTEGCESTVCLYGNQGSLLILQVDDQSVADNLRSQLANNFAATVEQLLPLGWERRSRSTIQSSSGELVEVLHYLIPDGEQSLHLITGLAVREGAFVTMEYYIYDEFYEEFGPIVDYSLSTFQWTE